MPNLTAPNSKRMRGWFFDQVAGRYVAVYNGVEVMDFDANDVAIAQDVVAAGTLTSTGILTSTAELRVANGQNIRVGTISAFATTQPTNAVVMRGGTEFAGAITTAGGIMSSATVLRKVIADGTVSNVG